MPGRSGRPPRSTLRSPGRLATGPDSTAAIRRPSTTTVVPGRAGWSPSRRFAPVNRIRPSPMPRSSRLETIVDETPSAHADRGALLRPQAQQEPVDRRGGGHVRVGREAGGPELAPARPELGPAALVPVAVGPAHLALAERRGARVRRVPVEREPPPEAPAPPDPLL